MQTLFARRLKTVRTPEGADPQCLALLKGKRNSKVGSVYILFFCNPECSHQRPTQSWESQGQRCQAPSWRRTCRPGSSRQSESCSRTGSIPIAGSATIDAEGVLAQVHSRSPACKRGLEDGFFPLGVTSLVHSHRHTLVDSLAYTKDMRTSSCTSFVNEPPDRQSRGFSSFMSPH